MYTKKAYEFSTLELVVIKAALTIAKKQLEDAAALPEFADWGPHIHETATSNLDRINKLYDKVELALNEEKLAHQGYESKLSAA